jgi:hypothetical protein
MGGVSNVDGGIFSEKTPPTILKSHIAPHTCPHIMILTHLARQQWTAGNQEGGQREHCGGGSGFGVDGEQ